MSVYQESRDLVLMGGYTKGQDNAIDEAHAMWPKIVEFIKQDQNIKSSYEDSINELKSLLNIKLWNDKIKKVEHTKIIKSKSFK